MQQKARQRPGVDKRTLLKRTFWLLDPETASLDAVIPTIDQLRGVNSVQVDRNKDRLTVMFDARHLCSERIVSLLADAQIVVRQRLLDRIRLSWYRFVEQNIQDNANREPWSCH